MGTYLNPGNSGFTEILRTDYVDKTGLIRLVNRAIGTKKKLICISRPRRFGKSYAAQMLCAYYDKSCDSRNLFTGYEIAQDENYEKHLNKYHVINIDVTGFVSMAKMNSISLGEVPVMMTAAILEEVKSTHPELQGAAKLTDCLLELVRRTKTKIIFVIDEWDSLIREAKHDEVAKDKYLNLLRSWFKNGNFTPEAVAAAYMTGILPIKKDSTQSAISDFQEYTMLEPLDYAEYVGFTEEEVKELCRKHTKNFSLMKKWFDGYTVGSCRSVYNPYSVMKALSSGKFQSYWRKTSAAETLGTYIDMDLEGLQEEVVRLIAGEKVVVDTDSFRNDVEIFTGRDDVLTLLIHLGYLTYEEEPDSFGEREEAAEGDWIGLARIPNEEVRCEFEEMLRKAEHTELVKLVKKSDQLLKDTVSGKAMAVAKAIQEIHDSGYAPNFYNNEQSLRSVIKMAYISCIDQYARLEELPSGHGIADIVFLPGKRTPGPAMVVELKWDKTAEGAIRQIKENGYPTALLGYEGEVLLVGINYNSKTKEHTCVIETMFFE